MKKNARVRWILRTIALLAALLTLAAPSLAASGKKSAAPTLKNAKVRFTDKEIVYTGEPLEPEITVTLAGETLTEGKDYTVTYSRNTDAGEATVRIDGAGAYKGAARRTFTIRKAENTCETENLILPVSGEAREYPLSVRLRQEAKLAYQSSRKGVSVTSKGVVKIRADFSGIAEITVTAPASKNFRRVSAKVYVVCCDTPALSDAYSRSREKGVVVWNACRGCTGYEIETAETPSFGNAQTIAVSNPKTLSAPLPLPRGTLNYVRVRSVYAKKDVSFTSPWSNPAVIETPETVMLFGSDFQCGHKQDCWQITPALMSRVSRAGYEPDQAVFCGDYADGAGSYVGDAGPGLKEIREDLGIFFGEAGYRTDSTMLAVQGNHEANRGEFPPSGPHETDAAIIYVIHTQGENPYQQGKTGERARACVEAAAEALGRYLDDCIARGERRPVIVATHVPLHFSRWTASETGDNLYSGILFDTLNARGDRLDILFLFGHNHGSHADNVIGGTCILRMPGETLLVPDPEEGERFTQRFRKEKLTFTYMNAGYIGYTTTNSGEKRSNVGLLLLYRNRMHILRYGLDGQINVSGEGVRSFDLLPEDYLSRPLGTATVYRK